MEATELIHDLREEIQAVEAQEIKSISIDGLKRYLDLAEKDIKYSNDFLQREHEGILTDRAVSTQWGTELFKAVIESGKSALNALILINGGAVIALMGVMANLVGKEEGVLLAKNLSFSLLLFGVGVFCGGFGFALRYISQAFYNADFGSSHTKYEIGGDIFRWLALIISLIGFVVFITAIICSFSAFNAAFTP